MVSGFTQSSNCCSVTWPSSRAACLRVLSSRQAFRAISAALSYPICGFNTVTSIKQNVELPVNLFEPPPKIKALLEKEKEEQKE